MIVAVLLVSCLVTRANAFISSRSVVRRSCPGCLVGAPARYALSSGRREDNGETTDESSTGDGSDDGSTYQPPKHTSSFLEHLESVRLSWPDADMGGTSTEGVACAGEPSVDPSRTMQASETDDSNWM